MSDKAMTVYSVEITPEQIEAGLAAMRGRFKASHVWGALLRAGVPETGIATDCWGRSYFLPFVRERAADRLLQRERKAGRIRAVNNKNWERIDD